MAYLNFLPNLGMNYTREELCSRYEKSLIQSGPRFFS